MKFNRNIFCCLILLFIIIIFVFNNIPYLNKSSQIRALKEESEIINVIKFNFTTNHNPNEIKNPISHLILNDVNIPIIVGTPNQIITSSLRFYDYLFYLSSPYIDLEESKNKSNIYNNKTSSSYKFIFHDSLFYKSNLLQGEKANETFYFKTKDQNNNLIIPNLTFYYSMKMNYNQSGGVVGLCLEDSNMNLHSGMNFLTQLKLKKAISYKTFFINYKNNESGELIIGAYPHEYSKAKYKYENYKDIRGYTETTFVIYGIIFDEIKFGDNNILLDDDTKRIMTVDLRLEFGFIQAPKIFEKNITDEFIDMEKCKSFKTNQIELYGNKLFGADEYIYYECDENYEINSNLSLSFTNKEIGYTFELNNKDLFMKYGNKKYFVIVFNSGYSYKSWIFGKPIFLKYKWVFDPDKKRLGIYTKEENVDEDENINNQNSKTLLIILIICACIFVIVLSIFIYQLFIKYRKNRKNRKNEILEDYDYNIN